MRAAACTVLILCLLAPVALANDQSQSQAEADRQAAEAKRLSAELERQVAEQMRHDLDQNRPAEIQRLKHEEARMERERQRHENELRRQRREAGIPDPTPTPEPTPERTPDPGGHLFRFDILRLDMGPSLPQLVLVLKCVQQLPCVFCREDTPAVCISRALSINLDNRAAGTVPAQPDAPFVRPSA